jgi:hypothetical protein
VLVLLVVVGWMSYFPGRHSLLALTLATGVGVGRLQSQVDALEEKAIRGAAFDETEKRFLEDLYTCLYKGTRLTFVLRQSAALMIALEWHADMPWKWPSYPELKAQYGDDHALSFPLPNARSLWQGRQHSLKLDDGLGEYLVQIGLAKAFMVRSWWIERTSASVPR